MINQNNNQKPSELFEGENSSLRKTFDEAVETKSEVSNDSREEIHQYVDRLNGRCFTSDVAVPKLGVRKKLDGFIDKLLADERKKVMEKVERYIKRNRSKVERTDRWVLDKLLTKLKD